MTDHRWRLEIGISESTVRQYLNRARMNYAAVGRTAPSKDVLLARAIEDGIIMSAKVALYTSYSATPLRVGFG